MTDGRFMMGQHRVPPVSLAEKRRLNALASRGGGDRVAIAKVARKQNGASLARAYALRYADAIADHELAALSQLSFEEHEELVTVGARVGVPATHPNKYGYATSAVIVSVSERQCADGKHRTLIPTPILAPSACSARSLRLPSQRPSLDPTRTRTRTPATNAIFSPLSTHPPQFCARCSGRGACLPLPPPLPLPLPLPLSLTRGRCLLHLDITHEERWESSKLVQKWILKSRCQSPPPPDVNSLAGALATSTLDHMSTVRV